MTQGPAILTLVRHGETSANTDGVWHGSTDTPLSERGRAQADKGASDEELTEVARSVVAENLEGKQIVKTIVVPGRLVNFVVK